MKVIDILTVISIHHVDTLSNGNLRYRPGKRYRKHINNYIKPFLHNAFQGSLIGCITHFL